MDQLPDHYAVLGIRPTADQEVIAAAYRALAKKFHPDTGAATGTASEEDFRAVREAYEILGDPVLRGAYDAELARIAAAGRREPRAVQRADPLAGARPGAAMPLPPRRSAAGSAPGDGRDRGAPVDRPRRHPGLYATLAAAVVGIAAAGWQLFPVSREAPAPGDPLTATIEPIQDAAPAATPPPATLPPAKPAVPAQPAVVAPAAPAVVAPAPKETLYGLRLRELRDGREMVITEGRLTFNSRKSCEDFGAQARQRRLDAGTIETGTPPEITFTCIEQ
jgi:hypothetical protein